MVNALPPKVPLTVAVPAVVPEVNVAVYVPLLLSVTVPNVPSVVDNATTPPELARLFPFPSFNCTVIVDVLLPSDVIELDDATIVDWVSEALSGVTLNALEVAPASEPLVALNV
jgi:hypothetical protein